MLCCKSSSENVYKRSFPISTGTLNSKQNTYLDTNIASDAAPHGLYHLQQAFKVRFPPAKGMLASRCAVRAVAHKKLHVKES